MSPNPTVVTVAVAQYSAAPYTCVRCTISLLKTW
jgi:hypothetical protein